ncbi:hypothetical protein FD755_015479 [Muntiacus reevesi]|uniref:Uncharacterized protein n=1 Tax=Muntiacus reevesi TaxID=9886 RepID=A0A5N3XHK0_MUNRE|nr:hypothetical protein FD755_015479 [Muntiacus reevesi]
MFWKLGQETCVEHSGSILNPPGSSVHGILQARIGIPKVAKGEKKMGRAKRRMQYNWRFVNIVPTFGKKKGPDVNSQILCNPGFL